MNCLYPIVAYDTGRLNPETGKRVIRFRPWFNGISSPNEIAVPCGKCSACRQTKRNNWINRCKLELLASHGVASFLTLTFRNGQCPDSLRKSDLQKFFKRLRNMSRDFGIDGKFKYFAVGEYGHLHERPHYHAIVFGVDFLNDCFRPYLATVKDGYPIFSSKVLECYWSYGFLTVDEVTDRNIRYVSKYVSKSDDGFFLSSQGLGRSFFVDYSRIGRSVKMSPTSLLRSCAQTDRFCFEPSKVRSLPDFALRYVEKFYPSLYDSLKQKRKVSLLSRCQEWFNPSVAASDINQSVQMENLKKVLHYE